MLSPTPHLCHRQSLPFGGITKYVSAMSNQWMFLISPPSPPPQGFQRKGKTSPIQISQIPIYSNSIAVSFPPLKQVKQHKYHLAIINAASSHSTASARALQSCCTLFSCRMKSCSMLPHPFSFEFPWSATPQEHGHETPWGTVPKRQCLASFQKHPRQNNKEGSSWLCLQRSDNTS